MNYLNLIPINLRHRSLRTWLTLLGIVIGVVAIVLLISFGDGLRASVTDQLDQFGTQNIVITPGSMSLGAASNYLPRQGKLYLTDVALVKGVPGVDFTSKVAQAPSQTITFKDQEVTLSPTGYESELFTNEVIPQYKILRGRFYKQGERNVAVIGYDFAYNIFDKPMSVGSNIYIAHEKYEVVGILEKVGNGGQPGSDRTIAISYEQARELAEGAGALGTNQISAIYVRVVEGFDPSLVGDQIAFKLRASHKVKENDFTMLTADYLKAQVETILGMITIFLGAVAGISLLVSAVGVSNTMFTAVVERTKEIGIMKSLGAKNSQILNMFLAESAGLCSVGGLIGLLVSIVFLLLFNFISNYFELGFEAVLTVWVIFFAFGFSLTIGIIAGVFPALQAANLNPVDALRR